jgi:hypothetical protein
MERGRRAQVLLHAGQVRADFETGDQRACVLAVRALQRETARRKRGLAHGRVEHAAHLGVPRVPAAREDHGLARPDVDRLAPLVDVAVLPEALHELTCVRMIARRVLRLNADDAARERLFANEVRELAEQHELHALLARRELERARERRAVRHGTIRDETARDVHLHGCERARPLAIRDAGVLGRDRPGLDVRLVAEHEKTDRAARA